MKIEDVEVEERTAGLLTFALDRARLHDRELTDLDLLREMAMDIESLAGQAIVLSGVQPHELLRHIDSLRPSGPLDPQT